MEKPVERIHPPFLDEIERRSACHDMFKHYFEDKPKQTNMEKPRGITIESNDLSEYIITPDDGCDFNSIKSGKGKILFTVKKKAPKRADDLSGLKVGDKVWSLLDGSGRAVDIDKSCDYPVEVKFDSGITESFTFQGFRNITDCCQSLFLTEIKYEIPTID